MFLALWISGCTAQNPPDQGSTAQLEFHQLDRAVAAANPSVSMFVNSCLAGAVEFDRFRKKALEHGWVEATEAGLEAAGFSTQSSKPQRNAGGKPLEQKQQYGHQELEQGQVLEIQSGRRSDTTFEVVCTLYAPQDEFLPLCATLGKVLKRAPDRNIRYPNREAHFIAWHFRAEEKAAFIDCINAPMSGLKPAPGPVLKFRITRQ